MKICTNLNLWCCDSSPRWKLAETIQAINWSIYAEGYNGIFQSSHNILVLWVTYKTLELILCISAVVQVVIRPFSQPVIRHQNTTMTGARHLTSALLVYFCVQRRRVNHFNILRTRFLIFQRDFWHRDFWLIIRISRDF